MKRTLTALCAVVVGAVLALPAAAITDGAPDGNGHPYVGLMVAQDANGNPLWRCSGALLSATVYLTAGHCTWDDTATPQAEVAHAEIWFAAHVDTDANYKSVASGGTGCANPAVTGYPCDGDVGGTPHTFPGFVDGPFYVRDAGVVVLDDAYETSPYGTLPAANALDSLKPRRSTSFTSVGYGLQKSFPDAAAWKNVADKTRMVAYPQLLQINTGFTGPQSLLLSNNTNTGGTCFGDSGGPNFLGDSNVVAGITSFGLNSTCAGTGGVFRTDRPDVRNWILSFLD